MHKLFALIAAPLLMFSAAAQAAPDKYEFDKDHTHIIFFISHLGFSKMIGRVKDFSGYFTFSEDDPAASQVDVTLNPASIDTDVPALNAILQGEKFFDVAKYPTIRFKSASVKVTGKNTGDVDGDMTMLGVVRPITLHVTYNKSGVHPLTNNYVSGFSADAVIDRTNFGMSAYAPDMVGSKVFVHIEVEGTDPVKHPGNVKTPG